MRVLLSSLVLLAFCACESGLSSSSVSTQRSHDALVWHAKADRPQLLSEVGFTGTGDAEQTARTFLATRAAELHLDGPGLELELNTTREGLAGRYLRFQQLQRVDGASLPVFRGEVIVLVRDLGAAREVRLVNLEHLEAATTVKPEGNVGGAAAMERALSLVKATREQLDGVPSTTLGVFVTANDAARLAWAVHLPMDESATPHDWTLYVDAATGAELGRFDSVRTQVATTGTAYVYDANAIASTNDLTMVDNNNAVTPALDAARFQVPLYRLDGSGFTRGQFADVRTRQANSRVVSMTNEFLFSRNNLGFEQANAYFHIDRAQTRIQALGFTNANNRMQEAVIDAQTADNSFYSGNNLRVNFGTGGVDDAEDGDIVVHEYGHSIQDNQVPGFGNGDEGAMGEGFGDYFGQSLALTLAPDAGHPQLSDPACVGDWDGTSYDMNTPKCLRRVDGLKHYPEDEAGEVHDDGEMWSAALWKLRAQLGADVTDKLVLEHHFALGTNATFFTASGALQAADRMLNAGVNGDTIRRTMIQYGLSRTLSTPAAMGPVTSLPISLGPTRDSLGNYKNDVDEVRTVRVPGATGLILHFVRVEFETNNQCLDNSCDNLYLLNGEGDLFQVVKGVNAQPFSSVAIAGDTVTLRMVSDPSQAKFGFQVDRIDVLGNVMDAGLEYDGGMDTRDAGVPVVDSGVPVVDSGVPVTDGGMAPPPPPRDAGVVTDAGQPVDAGTMTEVVEAAGVEPLSPAVSRGCGCGETSGASWLLGLVLLAVRRRR